MMKRREFLAASAAAATGLVAAQVRVTRAAASGRQFFELRTYHFKSPEKQQAYEQFMADAAVPAFNRAGVKPVGVWKALAKENPNLKLESDPTELWVLLPHDSLESVVGLEAKLAADAEFQKAGAAILHDTRQTAAFTRYDSTLLLAMEGAPRIQVPTNAATRVLELRTYQSRNVEKAINKLEMFNKGEFPLFAVSGMPGVFFGGAIVGQDLPQLTYMVAHETYESAKTHWGNFGKNPDWKTISSNPMYQDNVSKVISTFLRPEAGSQI